MTSAHLTDLAVLLPINDARQSQQHLSFGCSINLLQPLIPDVVYLVEVSDDDGNLSHNITVRRDIIIIGENTERRICARWLTTHNLDTEDALTSRQMLRVFQDERLDLCARFHLTVHDYHSHRERSARIFHAHNWSQASGDLV
ncbi:hypothetical protein [Methylobacterium nodulans]|uniref:Uncharacterized protein n=1 Tax=Methylobacterium nodulans (strain LMG 21967 / CNCM I-2342 / ORS 2060) TaxID=460265 RepID=B8IIS2_METNO|nr:hypothetical protein [Methylobacterium nodulans]ACL59949.1 hypothetical protein Mnod_5103 [Methylobacterium nodulans ORS 2060]